MILTRNVILEAVRDGGIKIEPFNKAALGAVSYEMTLHYQSDKSLSCCSLISGLKGLSEIRIAQRRICSLIHRSGRSEQNVKGKGHF
jgi:hypothetical protein